MTGQPPAWIADPQLPAWLRGDQAPSRGQLVEYHGLPMTAEQRELAKWADRIYSRPVYNSRDARRLARLGAMLIH